MDGRRTNRVTRSQASANANQANQTSSNVPDQPSTTPTDAQDQGNSADSQRAHKSLATLDQPSPTPDTRTGRADSSVVSEKQLERTDALYSEIVSSSIRPETAEDCDTVAKAPSTLLVVTRVERTPSTLYRPASSPTGQAQPLMGGSRRKALPDFASPPGPPFRNSSNRNRSESPDSPPTPIRSKNTRVSGPPAEVTSSLQSPVRAVQDSSTISAPAVSAKTSGTSQGKESEVLTASTSQRHQSLGASRSVDSGAQGGYENIPPRPQSKSAFQPKAEISGAMGQSQQKKGHPKQKLPPVRTQEEVARGLVPPFNPTSTAVSPSTASVPTQYRLNKLPRKRLNMDDTKDEQPVKRQQKDTGKTLDSDSNPVAQERNTGAVEAGIQRLRNVLASQAASRNQGATPASDGPATDQHPVPQNEAAGEAEPQVPHPQQEPASIFRNPQSKDLNIFMGAREDGSLFRGLEADPRHGPDGSLLVPYQEEEIDELTAIRNLQRRILEATNNFTSGNFPNVDETWVAPEDPDRGVVDLGEAEVISEHVWEQHPVDPEVSNFLNGFCAWGTCDAASREGYYYVSRAEAGLSSPAQRLVEKDSPPGEGCNAGVWYTWKIASAIEHRFSPLRAASEALRVMVKEELDAELLENIPAKAPATVLVGEAPIDGRFVAWRDF
ncbi:hypothetical protein QBC37DRAFT_375905 [Rhypophila decipiens]|uniref:Uncharacterized protein n=1 Tax=Rhypophila decipiens TaxID=261697 RepID=A0AAN7B676_9PEZI|nr:hypothetical protein QBC37DRAFT_375905 [Rhypophila decipiens]